MLLVIKIPTEIPIHKKVKRAVRIEEGGRTEKQAEWTHCGGKFIKAGDLATCMTRIC
jgi:hypothetical protein